MNLRAQTILVITGLTTVAALSAGWGAYALASRAEFRTVDAFLAERTNGIESVLDAANETGPPSRGGPPGAPTEGPRPGPPADAFTPSFPPPASSPIGSVPSGGPVPPPVLAIVEDVAGGDVVVRVVEGAGSTGQNPARGPLLEFINAASIDVDLPPIEVPLGDVDMLNVDIGGVEHRLYVEVLNDGTSIYVARSLDEAQSTLASLRRQLAVVIVPVILLSIALGWLAARRLSRPLESLSASAERVARTGELDVDFRTDAPGVVGSVARSFRSMLDSLVSSRDAQRRLVANAGHELRTPLTALRMNADLLATGRLSEADAELALSAISAETRELSSLTGELVELATVAADVEHRVSTDLCDIAERAADSARRRHGVEVIVEGRASKATVQPARIERAITNLVDNAVKFGPADTPITIRVDSNSVAVIDRGAGIDEGDLGQLFDRFYRSAAARSLPGSGLGLAIVDKVARDHGGRPFARNHANGVTIGFTLQPSAVRIVESTHSPAS